MFYGTLKADLVPAIMSFSGRRAQDSVDQIRKLIPNGLVSLRKGH
jgi:hypothetical protein